MRSALTLLIIGVLLTGMALLVPEPSPEARLVQEAEHLQGRIAEAGTVLDTLVKQALLRVDTTKARTWSAVAADNRTLNADGIELYVGARGQQFWTSTMPDAAMQNGAAPLVWEKGPDGIHLYATAYTKWGLATARKLIWYQPPFENRYLKRHFHPSLGVGAGVEASSAPGLGPVLRAPGAFKGGIEAPVMFRLQWSGEEPPPNALTHAKALALCLGLWLLVVALMQWLAQRSDPHRPWWGIVVFAAALIIPRLLVLHLDHWTPLDRLPLFDPSLFAGPFLLPSLGDLLINLALLVAVCTFARRGLRSASPPPKPALALLFSMILLLATTAWMNTVLISLVRDSRIPLDLFHVQDLDGMSALALLAATLLVAAWVLLADGLLRWSVPSARAVELWLITIICFGAALVAYQLSGIYDTLLVLWPLPLVVALIGIRRDAPRLAYSVLLVAGAALFVVHILNRGTFKRLEGDRVAVAESAATREDPIIELLFHEARKSMAADPDAQLLLGADSSLVGTAELDARLRQRFFAGPWDNYDVRLHLFGPNGTPRASTSPTSAPTLTQLRARFEQGIPVSGDPLLRNVHRPTEDALYIGVIGREGQGRLIVELLARAMPEGLGFPELLLAGDRAVDRRSDRFARARYERGGLVQGSGSFAFPIRWNLPISSDGQPFEKDGYELLATGDPSGTLIVLGSPLPGWLDHVTTFSYLFLLFALFGAAWLAAKHLLQGGPPPMGVVGKLRAGILLFASIALLLFAFGTQRLLGRHYSERSAEQLDERSRSAIASLRQHVHAESEIRPELVRDVGRWLDGAGTALLTDLSLYSPEGSILATTREQLFTSGLMGPRMDPAAYRALAIDGRSVFAHTERIGEAVFHSSYRPLLNDRGHVLAYLAVPYFARQSELDDERTAGYVAIVNLFVILFVLSVIAAAVIASWTTRPLHQLQLGLERIQLGTRNEPIPYRGNDELGDLVRVYNRKVEELRESAEKLARSERESAWREMAKQVAHEIKNPLTPMKLSIQHFERTWTPDAPDAKARMERFSAGLVEQIDALSRIANEFSNFAQMPPAHPQRLDLHDVARSAVALFASETNAAVVLHGETGLMVNADREHLLRVFTNLIKNALQALPDGQRAQVDVFLRSDGVEAIAEVRDNGIGIPEEIRDRIFTPSFTTKSSGMGLGLAMVKRMVEQAGGTVRFETHVGVGSTFIVSLPLHA